MLSLSIYKMVWWYRSYCWLLVTYTDSWTGLGINGVEDINELKIIASSQTSQYGRMGVCILIYLTCLYILLAYISYL